MDDLISMRGRSQAISKMQKLILCFVDSWKWKMKTQLMFFSNRLEASSKMVKNVPLLHPFTYTATAPQFSFIMFKLNPL